MDTWSALLDQQGHYPGRYGMGRVELESAIPFSVPIGIRCSSPKSQKNGDSLGPACRGEDISLFETGKKTVQKKEEIYSSWHTYPKNIKNSKFVPVRCVRE